MSATSSIQWTDKTWNPVRGCSIVSPGCHNCYAMKTAHRFSGPGGPYEGLTKLTERSGPQWTGKVRTVESALLEPLSWRKPQRVFVNSMSDLFHEDVPDTFIAMVFSVMASSEHTYQVLTKRAERLRDVVSRLRWRSAFGFVEFGGRRSVLARLAYFDDANPWEVIRGSGPSEHLMPDFVPPNVWLGVSVENQHFADERIPLLLQTPAAVRFISAEPLLGPVDLSPWLSPGWCCNHPGEFCEDVNCHGGTVLDWVIVGGESGTGARPFDLAWGRSIVQQCQAAGVACFCKQMGSRPMAYQLGDVSPLHLTDRKGGDPTEWPSGDWPREFPEVRA